MCICLYVYMYMHMGMHVCISKGYICYKRHISFYQSGWYFVY